MKSDLMQVVADSRGNGAGIGNRRKAIKQEAKCIALRNILCKIIKTVAIMWFRAGRGDHYIAYGYRCTKPVNKLERADTGEACDRICCKYK